jgi:hypothetical protein
MCSFRFGEENENYLHRQFPAKRSTARRKNVRTSFYLNSHWQNSTTVAIAVFASVYFTLCMEGTFHYIICTIHDSQRLQNVQYYSQIWVFTTETRFQFCMDCGKQHLFFLYLNKSPYLHNIFNTS